MGQRLGRLVAFAVLTAAMVGEAASTPRTGLASPQMGKPRPALLLAKADQAPAAADQAQALGVVSMTLLFTRQIAPVGVAKAPTAAIKQLSLDIATSYPPLETELTRGASAALPGVALPARLDAAHRERAELLESSFETQFEHEYVAFQIDSHTAAVAALRVLAATPALGETAKRIEAALGRNLEALQAAKRKLPAF